MGKVYDDQNANVNDNDDKTYIPMYPAKVNKSNLFYSNSLLMVTKQKTNYEFNCKL